MESVTSEVDVLFDESNYLFILYRMAQSSLKSQLKMCTNDEFFDIL